MLENPSRLYFGTENSLEHRDAAESDEIDGNVSWGIAHGVPATNWFKFSIGQPKYTPAYAGDREERRSTRDLHLAPRFFHYFIIFHLFVHAIRNRPSRRREPRPITDGNLQNSIKNSSTDRVSIMKLLCGRSAFSCWT